MKLIYISHWRFPSDKTMSPLIMKTCEMFARSGIAVELWVPWRQNRGFSGKDPFLYHDVEKNFIIRRLPSIDLTGVLPGNFFFLLMLVSFWCSLFGYAVFRLMFRGYVLYFHDARDVVPFFCFKKPTFIEIHDFYESGVGMLNRFIFRRARGFIVTNRVKMVRMAKEFHISERHMLHQPNAVDIAMFSAKTSREDARRALNLPFGEKIILYTGHLFNWKGVDTLFEARQFLQGVEKVYFVGGTDEDIEAFKIKSSKLNVTSVVIAGRKPHSEIPFWLSAADVLVLPSSAKYQASKYETSPVKLFEYMASGCPIVASDVPSIRDVVDGKMVWFFEPDSPRALADAVHAVFADPGEAARRSARARDEVKHYSWEERRDHIVQFIQERLS